MYVDDIQWTFNHTTGLYEIFLYNQTGQSARVVTLEMHPMQLHMLAVRLGQSVERDFPLANPPGMGKTDDQSTASGTMEKKS